MDNMIDKYNWILNTLQKECGSQDLFADDYGPHLETLIKRTEWLEQIGHCYPGFEVGVMVLARAKARAMPAVGSAIKIRAELDRICSNIGGPQSLHVSALTFLPKFALYQFLAVSRSNQLANCILRIEGDMYVSIMQDFGSRWFADINHPSVVSLVALVDRITSKEFEPPIE